MAASSSSTEATSHLVYITDNNEREGCVGHCGHVSKSHWDAESRVSELQGGADKRSIFVSFILEFTIYDSESHEAHAWIFSRSLCDPDPWSTRLVSALRDHRILDQSDARTTVAE